jgi:hypothetical protein
VSAPLDLDQIERLAREADGTSNPGDWWCASGLARVPRDHPASQSQSAPRLADEAHRPDREFIEALSPSVVLSLVERLRKAETQNATLIREAFAVVQRVRENYGEDIFGKASLGGPVDRYSAAGARVACDEITARLRELVLALEAL